MTDSRAARAQALAVKLRDFSGVMTYAEHCEAADLLDAYAAQAGQTCETCENAGPEFGTWRPCRLMGTMAAIPLTINGKSFSCAGWTPKEQR